MSMVSADGRVPEVRHEREILAYRHASQGSLCVGLTRRSGAHNYRSGAPPRQVPERANEISARPR